MGRGHAKKRKILMGAAGGEGKIGSNILETKIQGQMAAGWGEKYQFVS